jgi:hypothetical protein
MGTSTELIRKLDKFDPDQAMKEMAQAQKETARTLKKYVVDHRNDG